MNIKELLTEEVLEEYFVNKPYWLNGKFRIYRQYKKEKTQTENAEFLRKEYGIGGSSPAILDYAESHDGKGIKFYKFNSPGELTLSWFDVAKIIQKLIMTGRYLNEEQLALYPAFLQEEEYNAERSRIIQKYRELYHEYNTFAYENEINTLDYVFMEVSTEFCCKSKKVYRASNKEYPPIFVLPKMREAMKIIKENAPHLADKADEILVMLKCEACKPFELTENEEKELQKAENLRPIYVLTQGDKVYIGNRSYGIVSINENEVVYFDIEFPIMDEKMSRKEFDEKISKNCQNNIYLQLKELKI